MCKFCTYCQAPKHTLGKDIADERGNHRVFAAKQQADLLLGEPDRFTIHRYLNADIAAFREKWEFLWYLLAKARRPVGSDPAPMEMMASRDIVLDEAGFNVGGSSCIFLQQLMNEPETGSWLCQPNR